MTPLKYIFVHVFCQKSCLLDTVIETLPWEYLRGPWLGPQDSTAGSTGLILGQEINIPQVEWHDRKKKETSPCFIFNGPNKLYGNSLASICCILVCV